MLALTALCGEVPSSQFLRIPGSTSQKRKALTKLKKAGLLYPYSQNRLRGYRLSKEAKSYLLSAEPGKFDFFLTGYGDHDWVKGEIGKRIRYHRIAQTLTTMLNADVLVHRAEKAEVFSPTFTEAETLYVPAFYTAREVKAIGDDAIKIRGSRMVGVLLADTRRLCGLQLRRSRAPVQHPVRVPGQGDDRAYRLPPAASQYLPRA